MHPHKLLQNNMQSRETKMMWWWYDVTALLEYSDKSWEVSSMCGYVYKWLSGYVYKWVTYNPAQCILYTLNV